MDAKVLLDKINKTKTKYIVVTGGVCSSIGKGVLISSLGVLLKNAGYTVSVAKWDPYLNVDPGTMSPLEHGEVFVTKDGAETDLDLGHYERALNISLTRDSSVSSGQIYQEILQGEREGRFLGRCIQIVPHVVDAIKQRMYNFALNHTTDFVLLEIGGTVGDIEGQVFLEAIRQARMELGFAKILHAHLSYVPFLEWTGEVKTKPTQHSVNALKHAGLSPDCLFLRSASDVGESALKKLAVMCGVDKERVFQVHTYKPIYTLFEKLDEQGVGIEVQKYFGISSPQKSDLSLWKVLLERIQACTQTIRIGLIAKYVGSNDPYISVIEAIKAAGYACGVLVDIKIIDSEQLEQEGYAGNGPVWQEVRSLDGVVSPGGFAKRGSEGKIAAVRWCRENKIPYFGLCLGLQVMLIELARSLVGLEDANSTEFDKETAYPIISLLEEQKEVKHKGASMRLGEEICSLKTETKAYEAYGVDQVAERHRHRYEFNNKYKEDFEKAGVIFSGVNKDQGLVEIGELEGHPFMLGTQYHPEFLSAPLKPHPLFIAFIRAVLDVK